eukprot:10342038-Prorocentrum_lima.AAC.1
MGNKIHGTMLADKTQSLVWLLNDGKGECQDAISGLLTDTNVMAGITQFNSITTKKDMLLDECKKMKPDLL